MRRNKVLLREEGKSSVGPRHGPAFPRVAQADLWAARRFVSVSEFPAHSPTSLPHAAQFFPKLALCLAVLHIQYPLGFSFATMSNGTPPTENTPHSNEDSPASSSPMPQWPRPRTPLPPYRLAKLANALGISTPLPPPNHHASPPDASSLSLPLSGTFPKSSASSFSDFRRSPTPSAASSSHFTSQSTSQPPASKFLLHVIPPMHLPHDPDSAIMTPLPHTASGYHTQFRRGVLVPLFPTLQSQLAAIAKEYALPSTNGVVLYLVASSPVPPAQASISDANSLQPSTSDLPDEPGPRLSEDIWKHLWTRVAKTEQETFPARASAVNGIGLGLGFAANGRSSPQQSDSSAPTPANPLRTLVSTGRITPQLNVTTLTTPLTPNPSTPSSYTSSHSQVSPDTPNTSFASSSVEQSRANTLDLPGLVSPGIIPVLAKVEFDIDKRRAGWYEPWVRSRRANARKRVGASAGVGGKRSMSVSGSSIAAESEADGSEPDSLRSAPIGLKLVDRQALPRFLQSNEAEQSDEDIADSPSDLDDPTLQYDPDRPPLSITIPPPPPEDGGVRRRSSPTTATMKKPPPPPLKVPSPSDRVAIPTDSPSPLPTGSENTKLPYLRSGQSTATPTEASDETTDEEGAEEGAEGSRRRKTKSPAEEKRVGAFFEDLDLGLQFEDSGEFDMNDPNDRRRSQYVLKAQLDEIEKNLAQFSPRRLKHDLDQLPPVTPPSSSGRTLSPPGQSKFLGSPKLARTESGSPSAKGSSPGARPVWPAVPYSSLNNDDDDDYLPSPTADGFPAPPRLALNGVSNAIPVSPYARQRLSSASVQNGVEAADESMARKRDFSGEDPSYPDIMPPSLRKQESSNSPIIPLSPDPFGRFPSEQPPPQDDRNSYASTMSGTTVVGSSRVTYASFEVPNERKSSLSRNPSDATMNSDGGNRTSAAPSSRFSLDSTDDPHLNAKNANSSASLNPVKSIRKLWRKSNKASISSISEKVMAAAGRTSPQPPVPQQPPQQEVVTNAMVPPRRPMAQQQQQQPSSPMLMTTQAMQRAQANSSINAIHFDQESPYPLRRSPQPPPAQPQYANRPMSQRRPSES
ncbi:hypothetical protein EVG20_g1186, partial [Dentipellis fragilis]